MIDTSMFAADIPAGTYAVGDTVELVNVAGPAVVRSGRGAAYLKNIFTGFVLSVSGAPSYWKIKIENSDWIDPVINITGALHSLTAMDDRSGCNNAGHNCPLTPNSSWRVIAECAEGVTTTKANSLFALIDIDYPQVASVINPRELSGIPTGIDYSKTGATMNAGGSLTTAKWDTQSIDVLKAGYQYALDKVEMIAIGGAIGFLSLSNAAGMGGLTRIIPVSGVAEGIKQTISYASTITKGPMDIGLLLFATTGTAGTANTSIILDYVKRRV